PVDVQAAVDDNPKTPSRVVKINELAKDEMGLDIGPDSASQILGVLKNAKTVVWNGPLGMYEIRKYCYGTEQVLKMISNLEITSILGGGDIVACATKLGYKDKVSHASTGGGATLEYLEGKKLPGLEIIEEK
ncbi:MAG: phosphoglycerate kinase, partial [bacterium]|nr:phosphoglycerate kinase [bacterium]